MAITSKSQLKGWFVNAAKPNQNQFYAWFDSYWHKDEQISADNINGLAELLEAKADADQLKHYALLDASNIGVNQGAWRTALGINDITPPDVDLTNYYTKPEVDSLLENVTVDLSNYYTASQTESAITSKGYITAAALIGYATENWVTTQTTPATQTEVEASTGTESNPTSSEPATENRKFLTLFNFFKLIKKLRYIHLLPNSATAANRLRSNGSRLFYANNSAVESTVAYTSDLDTVINYTPTGNFTMSQLKTIVEDAGLKFRGIHIIIVLGSNNYTLNIDNGSTNINSLVTIGKRGTGTLNFTSSRTLTATDSITIMNGNEGSMSKIDFGTSTDILTVRNI